jgi:hypothetical protein
LPPKAKWCRKSPCVRWKISTPSLKRWNRVRSAAVWLSICVANHPRLSRPGEAIPCSSRFPGSKCNFRKCLAQFLGSFVLAAPDDGNTIDNKGIHHASSFSPARAGGAVSTGAFSVWAADTPVKGGTLIYLEQQPHTNLYPPAGGFYNGGILNQITDKLTWQNPKTLEIEPWIAESWTATPIKPNTPSAPGITFSDGTPLDANAVAKNFDTYGLAIKPSACRSRGDQ